MEQRFSRKLARLERRGAVVEPRVGGIEQSGATQLVVADIWGGLFDEIPAFAYEPPPTLSPPASHPVLPPPFPLPSRRSSSRRSRRTPTS
jgi:hypothetical protein